AERCPACRRLPGMSRHRLSRARRGLRDPGLERRPQGAYPRRHRPPGPASPGVHGRHAQPAPVRRAEGRGGADHRRGSATGNAAERAAL
ncbi:Type II secretory pathway, ATPase PulE/Tfp pilus assembly pathway, ATPase PilB, partial [Pseudomonas sp. FEN]